MESPENSLIHQIKNTISSIWLHGEWCKNEGHNSRNYFIFRRECGEAYFLTNKQLEDHLRDLIYQF